MAGKRFSWRMRGWERRRICGGVSTATFGPFATDGDESEGVIAVPGFQKKVSPLTGVTGNLLLWLLMSRWTDQMAKPYFDKRGC